MEGVIILHDTIHELHRKKKDEEILNLDFEKAYDNLKLPFIQVLRIKGFSPVWCEWISKAMSRGSVATKVNHNLGHYFQTRKGVRQGIRYL
jgi:hypothetical protein